MRTYRRVAAAVTAAVVAGAVLTGCGILPGSGGDDAAAAAKPSGRVALLLPERAASRYDAADAPYFSQRLKQLCPACEIDYRNAGQDAAEQLSQAEDALAEGAKVLVLTPVDSTAAAKIVELAHDRDVPVVSYDRLVLGTPVDYYVSFDNAKVGRLQAEALLSALGGRARTGEILWINGSPTDNNATLFKKGAHETLDGEVRVAAEFDTPEWDPANAEAWTARTLKSLGGRELVGVYAANDGTAGGAIKAMRAAGLPAVPVTGQDAEVAALQRILAGSQHMTVYKAVRLEAEKTAELAFELLRGGRPEVGGSVDNGAGGVPSLLLDPVTVTKDNIEETVIRDGYVTPGALCAGAYAEACSAAGIG
ncbi:sugar ABC transporter substrate-binding protein [Planobispora longispora]|uniref:Solute-binding protein n=1 Tax=Planobispora longispora TaxID=28887 RepID=A0A8J3RUJ7_9ACTN|nr:sugar ABC transporter substrate-binding protein [Planobispora longispora]GIH81479.1 solute-binding protein [Planobispora longispora]